MSFSAPSPQRRDPFTLSSGQPKDEPAESVVQPAREQAERLAERPATGRRDVGPGRPIRAEELAAASDPPVLRRLLDHELARSAARRARDTDLADHALGQVVGDLDSMLATAAKHLRLGADKPTRQRVRDAVTGSAPAALPLGEVAELLDLPRAELDAVLAALRSHGGIGGTERREALDRIGELRTRLATVKLTRDHALLDRIVTFVVKIATLVAIAVAAAPLGALAIGESVLNEVIKAGVIALVTVAVRRATADLDTVLQARDPNAVARAAHQTLLDELGLLGALADRPAFDGEHTAVRVRVMVRVCAARTASIPLAWARKQQYWTALDEVGVTLHQPQPHRIAQLRRRLQALTPPRRRLSWLRRSVG